MGILSKLRSYNGKWNVASKTAFSTEDLAEISSNEIVPSEYGKSLKLNRVNGQVSYIPVSNTCEEKAEVGKSIDLSKCFILTLSRSGDEDIYRVEF